jgi:hypothetical protein
VGIPFPEFFSSFWVCLFLFPPYRFGLLSSHFWVFVSIFLLVVGHCDGTGDDFFQLVTPIVQA